MILENWIICKIKSVGTFSLSHLAGIIWERTSSFQAIIHFSAVELPIAQSSRVCPSSLALARPNSATSLSLQLLNLWGSVCKHLPFLALLFGIHSSFALHLWESSSLPGSAMPVFHPSRTKAYISSPSEATHFLLDKQLLVQKVYTDKAGNHWAELSAEASLQFFSCSSSSMALRIAPCTSQERKHSPWGSPGRPLSSSDTLVPWGENLVPSVHWALKDSSHWAKTSQCCGATSWQPPVGDV